MCVCLSYVRVPSRCMCPQSQKKKLDHLELELTVTESYREDAGNQSWVLIKEASALNC